MALQASLSPLQAPRLVALPLLTKRLASAREVSGAGLPSGEQRNRTPGCDTRAAFEAVPAPSGLTLLSAEARNRTRLARGDEFTARLRSQPHPPRKASSSRPQHDLKVRTAASPCRGL